MAAVVPDLVEDGSLQKIGPRHRAAVDLTLPGLPRLPVADLRVGREQQHVSFSRLAQFERKDETRVVGIALKRQSQFRRRTEPIAIDAPPVVALGGVAPGVVLAEEIVDLPPVFLVDGTTVRQPWSALLAERDRHPLMERRHRIVQNRRSRIARFFPAVQRLDHAERQGAAAGDRQTVRFRTARRRIDLTNEHGVVRRTEHVDSRLYAGNLERLVRRPAYPELGHPLYVVEGRSRARARRRRGAEGHERNVGQHVAGRRVPGGMKRGRASRQVLCRLAQFVSQRVREVITWILGPCDPDRGRRELLERVLGLDETGQMVPVLMALA